MGFQRLRANQQNVECIAKVRSDENGDRIGVTKTPKGCDLRRTKEFGPNNNEPVALDANYTSWLIKHPSALSMFDQMMNAAKGKRIVVFLDYDGTLSPIVEDPDKALMSDPMRSAVGDVARYFPTAIISGRCRDKVLDFVQLNNVYYAGSHGMDIMVPLRPLKSRDLTKCQRSTDEKGNEAVVFQPAQEYLSTVQEIIQVLAEKTKTIGGVRIEDNKFCISVHFRRVRQEDFQDLEERVKSTLKEYPLFHLTRGRKVLEVRPSIEWDKGNAVEYLLDTLGLGNSNDVFPVYIGDDRTDEDAFKAIQSRGQGYPILVSSIPKETMASYSLRDPSEVMFFLLQLARWRKNSSGSRVVT
ncbi:PREDICTED: probable trehalose-phosphate phosphatase C [Nelumbo nucifera]|uniref:Trehalose 6-phosphate phosphatase n=1 Tax=Nelumbo nucifera TaxID=4432 RepID=A0A1U8AHK2_NELNU|nr:PREDICTED: probable trehalose-phosphate phosphatase C [Nelumbo nucifera]